MPLRHIGLKLEHLKASWDSIDYKKCIIQEGDKVPEPFSFLTESIKSKQIPCFITHTNERHMKLFRKLKDSPLLMEALNLGAQGIALDRR